jgi:hypothetical protein
MVKKPISGDSEQRERDSERSRKASQLSASGLEERHEQNPRPQRARQTPSNGGPAEENAHGALVREGIDSD